MCGEIINDIVNAAIGIDAVSQSQSTDLVPTGLNSRQHKRSMTWKERACAVFYYLHPALTNFDSEVTCSVFGIRHATFSNWINDAQFFAKWIPFVEGLTVRDALSMLPNDVRH